MLVPAGAEEGLFKPTADDWIFSAPNPWTFARRRSYLVTHAQKAELAQRVRRSMYFRLLAFIPLIAVTATTLFLFPSLLRPASVGGWLWLALLTVLATVAINLSDYLTIRPSLAGLPRTTERISFLEMCGRQARSMSVARLATLTAIETFVFIVILAEWVFLPRTNIYMLIGAACFGAIAMLCGAMLFAKLKSQPAAA
jgi:hypothetical protein